MTMDLRRHGRGVVELCQRCDQDRPARAAWLNLLASGRLSDRHHQTEADVEEAKQLWAACLMDVLSASPLGLPVQFPPADGRQT